MNHVLKDNLEDQEAVRVAVTSLKATIQKDLLDVIESFGQQTTHNLEVDAVKIEEGEDSDDDGSCLGFLKLLEKELPGMINEMLSSFLRERFEKAVEKGEIDVIRMLLTMHDIDYYDDDNDYGWGLLFKAINWGQMRVVKLLLPLIKKPTLGNIKHALTISMDCNYFEIMRILLEDPKFQSIISSNIKENDVIASLMYEATGGNRKDILALLVEFASPESIDKAIEFARRFNKYEILEVLEGKKS